MPTYCFFELATGLAAIPGKIIVELFDKQVPKVAENFRVLCTGELGQPKYQGTTFHRVVETFTIQGGDTEGNGTGGMHIFGDQSDPFAEEDLFWRDIDEEMLLCMAENPPRSQFFITLRSSPHLNGLHCCFGKVLRGQQILQQISQLPVDDKDCPIEPITIARCGELEYKGPQKAALPKVGTRTVHEKSTKPGIHESDSRTSERQSRSRTRSRTRPEAKAEGRRRSRRRQYLSRSPRRSPPRGDRDRPSHHNHNYGTNQYPRRRFDGYDDGEQTRPGQFDYDRRHGERQRVPDVIYKGRGKMMYQADSKPDNRSGRLT